MARVTVKDISTKLNISLGTVSKALSGKDGVNIETRKLVIETANTMGYKVNKLAQSLSRNPLLVGVLMPSAWPEYYSFLEIGIKDGFSNFRDYNLYSLFTYVPSLFSRKEIEKAEEFIEQQNVNAVIICPALDPSYKQLVNKLSKRKIVTLLLGRDIPDTEYLACVRTDSPVAGAMAGEFLDLITPPGGDAVVLIGNKDHLDHTERVEGFARSFVRKGHKVKGVYETQDDPELAHFLAGKVIREQPDLRAIYVATGNSIAVCRCIEEMGLQGKISIVATDIYPEIRTYMEKDIIQGVIFQDQIRQGENAVRVVFDYLSGGIIPSKSILIQPQLIMRSNLVKTCGPYLNPVTHKTAAYPEKSEKN
ncbi:MAG: LacI family DNA-binding transcriptional regulator [Treponema sp.]|jgi:LacI family transcriptional regulator|nr:LacI family DNA-binding transcriptional regulator [Treponema sp.]